MIQAKKPHSLFRVHGVKMWLLLLHVARHIVLSDIITLNQIIANRRMNAQTMYLNVTVLGTAWRGLGYG